MKKKIYQFPWQKKIVMKETKFINMSHKCICGTEKQCISVCVNDDTIRNPIFLKQNRSDNFSFYCLQMTELSKFLGNMDITRVFIGKKCEF